MTDEQFDDLESEELELGVEQETQEEPEDTESNIPDKFKGKSIEDVIDSYTALEKAYGQRGNDLGDMRKLADQLLEQQLSKKETPAEEDFDVDSLLDNPEETVSKLVEKKTKPLMDELEQYKRNSAKEVFEKQHPDFLDVVNSPEFQGWVNESPVRQRMFIEADKQYDYEMGSEILNLYKATNEVRHQQDDAQEEVNRKKRSKALKNASTESGTAGTPSKKVFSRKQLMNLRLSNPNKYEAMSKEIYLAYQEGRVKD